MPPPVVGAVAPSGVPPPAAADGGRGGGAGGPDEPTPVPVEVGAVQPVAPATADGTVVVAAVAAVVAGVVVVTGAVLVGVTAAATGAYCAGRDLWCTLSAGTVPAGATATVSTSIWLRFTPNTDLAGAPVCVVSLVALPTTNASANATTSTLPIKLRPIGLLNSTLTRPSTLKSYPRSVQRPKRAG